MFAHPPAYPMLVGRDIQVDCRRRLGVRSFSSSLPPDLGLRTSFGRETGGDRREARLPVLMLRPLRHSKNSDRTYETDARGVLNRADHTP